MTRERIRFIFIIFVIAVIAIGLSIQLSSNADPEVLDGKDQKSVLMDSTLPESTPSETNENILGTSEQIRKIEPKLIGEECYVGGCSNQICTDEENHPIFIYFRC